MFKIYKVLVDALKLKRVRDYLKFRGAQDPNNPKLSDLDCFSGFNTLNRKVKFRTNLNAAEMRFVPFHSDYSSFVKFLNSIERIVNHYDETKSLSDTTKPEAFEGDLYLWLKSDVGHYTLDSVLSVLEEALEDFQEVVNKHRETKINTAVYRTVSSKVRTLKELVRVLTLVTFEVDPEEDTQ